MRNYPLEAPQILFSCSQRGFFAVTMVVLLLAITTLALIGPYQLAHADWQAARRAALDSQAS